MTIRGRLAALLVLVAVAPVSVAGQIRTQNFLITTNASEEVTQQFAQLAEYYRREKAIQWLGREMPPWPRPCPVRITVQPANAGGATEFDFDPQRGGVAGMRMHIEGPYDRLLYSVLPHEITHTVFAHHFGRPVPRWADEGGSVLSEDDKERNRHDSLCRTLLNQGRGMRLRTLFNLHDYPSDVMVLYAQGFSVSRFLVEQRDRATFLAFLGAAMQGARPGPGGMALDWDGAAQRYYGFRSLEQMEQVWLDSLRHPRPAAGDSAVAQNTAPHGGRNELTTRVATRDTSLPTLQLEAPVVRGQSPLAQESGRFGDVPPAYHPPGPGMQLLAPRWNGPPR